MTEPRIYVACLASYNNGVLHGRWIDLDDREEVEAEIAEMLRESTYPNVRVTCPTCDGDSAVRAAVELSRRGFAQADCDCGGTGTVPSAEEYAIHDYEGLPHWVGEHTGLDAIFEYLDEAQQCHSDEERAAFDAWVSNLGGSVTYARFQDDYRGTYTSAEAAAEEWYSEAHYTAMEAMPDSLRYHIDWEGVARSMQCDFTFLDTEFGVAMFWNN